MTGQINVREWDDSEAEFLFVAAEADENEEELTLETEEMGLNGD